MKYIGSNKIDTLFGDRHSDPQLFKNASAEPIEVSVQIKHMDEL